MSELLVGPIPAETEATCADCAMVVDTPCAQPGYLPEAKCCTFFPRIPNFIVGRLLADGSLHAGPIGAWFHATIDGEAPPTRVDNPGLLNGSDVTPMGLAPPATYLLVYNASHAAFGKTHALRCPFFLPQESKQCAIWRHRNAVCSTFFCKHGRAAVGKRFWSSLLRLLGLVEHELALWCVLKMGPEAHVIELLEDDLTLGTARTLDRHQVDGGTNPDRTRAAWAGLGAHRDFFLECGQMVAGLSWSDVARACGPRVAAQAEVLQEAHEKLLSSDLPPRLELGSFMLEDHGVETSRLVTYSPNDPLVVPSVLLGVLHHFDGRPVEQALEAIRSQEMMELEPDLVRRLVDFDVLKEVP